MNTIHLWASYGFITVGKTASFDNWHVAHVPARFRGSIRVHGGQGPDLVSLKPLTALYVISRLQRIVLLLYVLGLGIYCQDGIQGLEKRCKGIQGYSRSETV